MFSPHAPFGGRLKLGQRGQKATRDRVSQLGIETGAMVGARRASKDAWMHRPAVSVAISRQARHLRSIPWLKLSFHTVPFQKGEI